MRHWGIWPFDSLPDVKGWHIVIKNGAVLQNIFALIENCKELLIALVEAQSYFRIYDSLTAVTYKLRT